MMVKGPADLELVGQRRLRVAFGGGSGSAKVVHGHVAVHPAEVRPRVAVHVLNADLDVQPDHLSLCLSVSLCLSLAISLPLSRSVGRSTLGPRRCAWASRSESSCAVPSRSWFSMQLARLCRYRRSSVVAMASLPTVCVREREIERERERVSVCERERGLLQSAAVLSHFSLDSGNSTATIHSHPASPASATSRLDPVHHCLSGVPGAGQEGSVKHSRWPVRWSRGSDPVVRVGDGALVQEAGLVHHHHDKLLLAQARVVACQQHPVRHWHPVRACEPPWQVRLP